VVTAAENDRVMLWDVIPNFSSKYEGQKKKVIVNGVHDGIRTHDLENTEQEGWPVQGEIRSSIKVTNFAGMFV